ncbi:hypothetical protein K440DRAFT_642704 [Wilcoxina mikolae CBS 423.85]|nr:hypothetical protein K440DRAFT_642704 [Wilcoxina mikolae CBS 423.85]
MEDPTLSHRYRRYIFGRSQPSPNSSSEPNYRRNLGSLTTNDDRGLRMTCPRRTAHEDRIAEIDEYNKPDSEKHALGWLPRRNVFRFNATRRRPRGQGRHASEDRIAAIDKYNKPDSEKHTLGWLPRRNVLRFNAIRRRLPSPAGLGDVTGDAR